MKPGVGVSARSALRQSIIAWLESESRDFRGSLRLPLLMMLGFLFLAAVTTGLDHLLARGADGNRLAGILFASPPATRAFLVLAAGGMLFLTGVACGLLFLASLGPMASFEATGSNRTEPASLGYLAGTSLYMLVILATVSEAYNPVSGALAGLALTAGGLYLLIFLLYRTANRLRPETAIRQVSAQIVLARQRQGPLLASTRREFQRQAPLQPQVCLPVQSLQSGYLTGIALDGLRAVVQAAQGEVEIVLKARIGEYLTPQEVVAEVYARAETPARRAANGLPRALVVEAQRNPRTDPTCGLEQLETFAWTAISSARDDPGQGLLAIRSLRDLLARFADEAGGAQGPHLGARARQEPLPVVYPDGFIDRIFGSLESLGVASSGSMQHQAFTEVILTLAGLYPRLTPELQARANQSILRLLSALGDHVLTGELDASLDRLVERLREAQQIPTARAVAQAQVDLRQSVGKLRNRTNRVKVS